MIKAGVIGHPIAHSKSPRIHGYWLARYGIDGEYKAYDVHPHLLEAEIMRLRDEGLAGFNVTLPHKQSIISLCTTLNDEASRIGAVNTVVFHKGGEIEGRNTDAFGFMRNATDTHPDFVWLDAPAVVLGAGGAARAILFALKRAGVPEIRLTNRTLESAEALAEEFGCVVYEWDDRQAALKGSRAVVNTTSLGMTGQPPLEIDLAPLGEGGLAYDIVYAPLHTPFLQQADALGCRVVTGIGMLLHQARPGFQAWFGHMPEVDDELLAAALA